jgi:helix-turn-helix protein
MNALPAPQRGVNKKHTSKAVRQSERPPSSISATTTPIISPVDKLRFRNTLAGDRRLNDTDGRVATIISDLYRNDWGHARPSHDYIARATGCDLRGVGRSVNKLHRLGIIVKKRRNGPQ